MTDTPRPDGVARDTATVDAEDDDEQL